jgi:mercuric ion transport protein
MRETLSSLVAGLLSFLAASCCLGPALFVVFGLSLGGMGFLRVLEPFRWWFLGGAYLAISYSFYRLYFRKKPDCACEEPSWSRRLSLLITWIALLLLVVATFYPFALEKLYGG